MQGRSLNARRAEARSEQPFAAPAEVSQSEGVGASSADLDFARKQLANLEAQLPHLEAALDFDGYAQASKRIEQLQQTIAVLEDAAGPQPEIPENIASYARTNGLHFTHVGVKPREVFHRDERPSGSLKFDHTQPDNVPPVTRRPHDPNPPKTAMQFSHSDEYQAQADKDATELKVGPEGRVYEVRIANGRPMDQPGFHEKQKPGRCE